ncbi:MAG: ParA family protein [Roseiarcus sp.]|jgi:chromosome partitioning protein
MRTIAFVTQKGGSGKSTLASSLAVAAKEVGERVCVIDLDPQASLVSWSKTRELDDIAVVAATAGKLPALIGALEKKGITLAIIDTPGADGAASAAAMREADLNVIPSRPSIFDLWASAQTRAALKAAASDFVFMLNQCPPAQQTARVDNAVAALEEMGGLISPLVLARVDYQEAARHGLGVTEINPHGAAAQEMRALWASLKRRLARGKAKAPTSKAA